MGRPTGLTLGGAQVGLEAPAVATIGIAIGLERGEHAVGAGFTEQEPEPLAVEEAGVGRHERRSGVQVDGHTHDRAPLAVRQS